MENMKDRIEKAKAKAEAEIERKLELARNSSVAITDLLTLEEFDAICQRNEEFLGSLADMEKVQRHMKLQKSARWLHDHSMEVTKLETEPMSRSHPNAIVTLTIRRLASLRGEEKQVFTLMCALADTIFMSSLNTDVLHITFGIEDIWQQLDKDET